MLDWLAAAFGVVDAILGWRLYGCAIVGAICAMVTLVVGDRGNPMVISLGFLVGGIVAGLLWERQASSGDRTR